MNTNKTQFMNLKNRIWTTLAFTTMSFLTISCSQDDESINQELQTEKDSYTVSDFTVSLENKEAEEQACFTRDLIAEQHEVVGQVSININDDGSWTLTYQTIDGWSLSETHLDLSKDCTMSSFPVTKSGNPQVGKFDYAANHEGGVNKVEYTIYQDQFSWNFCFAAHAVVDGPQGSETAWAKGESFGGKNWAMYVQANLIGCLQVT